MDSRHSGNRLPPQRYTIPRLLQIAAHSHVSFDLSKFTYDAARGECTLGLPVTNFDLYIQPAGVVPQLGDIAMPTRRISNQRTRGWSSESFEPSVVMAAFEGNTAQQSAPTEPLRQPSAPILEPRRQPSGPPVETKAQKDAGFARFLKKHASPTHNRVTAGGRIVPMEKHESPPKFDLVGTRTSTDALRRELKDKYHHTNSLPGVPGSPEQDIASDILLQPPPTVDREDSRARNSVPDEAQATMPQKDHIFAGPTAPGYNFMNQSLPAIPMFEPSHGFGHTELSMNYPVSQQVSVSALIPITPAGWQYSGLNSTSALTQDVFDRVEPTTRLLVSSQNCLGQAEAHFSNLDRQLKAIDRYRAMSQHDPSLAAQRYAIVQRRAEAKELVSRLEAQVEALQSLKGPLVDPIAGSGLLAGAKPFVPQGTCPVSCESSRPPTARGSIDLSIEADYSLLEKPLSVGKRKIIPIVAPPASPTRNTCERPSSTPPVHASSVLKGASGEFPDPPILAVSSQDSIQHRVPALTKSHTEPLEGSQMVTASAFNSATDENGPQVIRWAGDRPGLLPAELAEWTESYYDALRLPEGVITVFTLDNDVCFEVFGARLQRPEAVELNDMERDYWSKKPVFTKTMLEELRSKADIVDDEDYSDDYLLGRATTPTLDEQDHLDDNMSVHSDEGGVQLQKSINMHQLLEEAIQVEAGHRRQAASAPQPVPATNTDENRSNPDVDLSNKGYSSVAVQNINATVRLPPSFDGTTENKTRNAKSVLAAANKIRSPRVLHRASPQGGA